MKKLVIILIYLLPMCVYSQSETSNDSTYILKKETPVFNEKLNHYLQPGSQPTQDLSNKTLSNYNNTIINTEMVNLPTLSLPPLNFYRGVPIEKDDFTRYLFANDFNYYSNKPLNNNLWLSSSSALNTYPTLGFLRNVNLNLNYQPANWLIISGGAYGAKYNIFREHFNDAGFNGSIKFILTDRIRINAYGQYSIMSDKNNIMGPLMNMYPGTYYGGTLEVKINDKFGIEGGIMRELNPFTGKWENKPYFAPVFYSK